MSGENNFKDTVNSLFKGTGCIHLRKNRSGRGNSCR